MHWNEPFVNVDITNVAKKHFLSDCKNLTCTPHSAWYSKESRKEMREIAASYVKSFYEQRHNSGGSRSSSSSNSRREQKENDARVARAFTFPSCVNKHLMENK